MNTIDVGTYDVTATLSNGSDPASTTFDVEHPLATFSAVMITVAISSVFALFMFFFGDFISIRLIEISNFIFISSIVVNLMLALLFADTELGPNSVIGLVFKHSVDEKGRLQQGGQIMVNFGGSQRDNYANGIQIPVYALGLGLAGGYLRYLRDTFRNTKYIIQELDEIKEEVLSDGYLFYPDPKPSKERHFWRTKRADEEVKQAMRAESDEERIEREKTERQFKEIGVRQRHYYLFEILKRVGLVLLSPILTSAVWLFLNQLGFQNQSIVLGAVSFSIGLVTEEAVNFIIRSATKIFGNPTDTAKTGTAKTGTAKTGGEEIK
jgi:hypothetical protein